MMNHKTSLALLLLSGCVAEPESGIDRTFIRGTVELPPGAFVESETKDSTNNDAKTAQELGYITTRYTIVQGNADGFGIMEDEPISTPDTYSINPTKSGNLNLSLQFVGSTYVDEKSSDRSWYFVTITDEDGNVVLSDTTEGSFGAYTAPFSVESGVTYYIELIGGQNRDDSDGTYTLILDGFNPNGVLASVGQDLDAGWTIEDGEMYTQSPIDFLVGVYQNAESDARGLPVGGTDVPSFTLDTETYTWSGEYEVTYVYSAVLPEDVDTGEFAAPVVDASLTDVHLFAGTFPSLNAGITAGTFYSSTPLSVDLSTAVAEEYEAGFLGVGSTNRVLNADPIVCDVIQPKQYGWTEADAEPNDFADAGDGYTIVDTAGAQVLPEASGAGFIDTITGSLEFTDAAPSWIGDHDAFVVTVPTDLNAYLSLAWGNPTFDLDLHLYDSAGALVGAGWAIANSNPEEFSVTDFADPLLPGETYYIAVLPWSGEVGTIDYSIEIEWLAP